MAEEYENTNNFRKKAVGVFGISAWPIVLAYSLPVCIFIVISGGIVSRFIGMPKGAPDSLLLDMVLLIVIPVTGGIFWYMNKSSKEVLVSKQHFIKSHQDDHLVVTRYNPHSVYKVMGEKTADGKVAIMPIWNSDGEIVQEKILTIQASDLREFNAATFLIE